MHEPFRLTHDDVLAILNTRNIAYFARGENGYHVINFLEVATKQLEALKTFTEQHMNVYPFSRDVFCIIMTIYKDEVDRSIREARTENEKRAIAVIKRFEKTYTSAMVIQPTPETDAEALKALANFLNNQIEQISAFSKFTKSLVEHEAAYLDQLRSMQDITPKEILELLASRKQLIAALAQKCKPEDYYHSFWIDYYTKVADAYNEVGFRYLSEKIKYLHIVDDPEFRKVGHRIAHETGVDYIELNMVARRTFLQTYIEALEGNGQNIPKIFRDTEYKILGKHVENEYIAAMSFYKSNPQKLSEAQQAFNKIRIALYERMNRL